MDPAVAKAFRFFSEKLSEAAARVEAGGGPDLQENLLPALESLLRSLAGERGAVVTSRYRRVPISGVDKADELAGLLRDGFWQIGKGERSTVLVALSDGERYRVAWDGNSAIAEELVEKALAILRDGRGVGGAS